MSDHGKLTRRQLLRGKLPLGGPSQPAADPSQPTGAAGQPQAPQRASKVFPLIRPPGAVDEVDFIKRCTSCELCQEACPHDAIVKAPIRFRGAAGTPMIDAAQVPCYMCAEMPCIAACPEDALMLEALGPIAEARLLDYNCLAHQGSFCTVCAEQCPVPDAITLSDGKPTIHLDPCTGCGICHYACPAPTNAIAMMPLKTRKIPPAKNDADPRTTR